MKLQKHKVRDLYGVDVGIEHVSVAAEPGPLTPVVKPHRHRPAFLRDFLVWWKGGIADPLLVTGPTGSGKSSGIQQILARMNAEVVVVDCHEKAEFDSLLVNYVPEGNGLVPMDGALVQAMDLGIPILLEEVDALDPSARIALNRVSDGYPVTVMQTGAVVHPKPGFRIIMTGNTAGIGDHTGLYAGTLRQNFACADRPYVIQLDYPAPDEEEQLIVEMVPTFKAVSDRIRAASGVDLIAKMVEVAGEVRKAHVEGQASMGSQFGGASFGFPFSTRTLIRWASTTVLATQLRDQLSDTPVRYGLDRAIALKLDPANRAALYGIAGRVLDTAFTGETPS